MRSYRLLEKEECYVNDPFWNRYTDLVRESVIPYQWNILNDKIPDSEPSHAIDNFRIAAGDMEGKFYGQVFQDSDVSKWLEAVGNILSIQRNDALEEKADSVIDIIARAQQTDGYLDTYFIIEEPDKKWINVLECHELYNAGHFIEGAIAYYQATGKEKVYHTALNLADHIDTVFGPEAEKLHGYPGHQEIEIALLHLYDVSQNKKYLKLAQYFIDTRGTNRFFEEEFEKRDRVSFWTKEKVEQANRYYNQFPYNYYNQFHLPVREQTQAVGHAVRGVYMYTAMADLASRIEDEALSAACEAIWKNITEKQMYITGGIGATHSGEAFTADYDLPNDTNYSETCASIGLIFFAQKMLKSHMGGRYGDVIEQALYNTVLGGMNYEGNRFFYVNPLAVVPEACRNNTERYHVKPVRQKWFACACCPPNIARLIGGLRQYIYTADKKGAYVHLYVGSSAVFHLAAGNLSLTQTTDYPWDEKITIKAKSDVASDMTIALRLPQWSSTYQILIDGEQIAPCKEENGFLYLTRNFIQETEIILNLDMQVRLIAANPKVHYNAGRIALARGPLLYCLEETDNGKYLDRIQIDTDASIEVIKEDMFGGCITLGLKGCRDMADGKTDELYLPYHSGKQEIKMKAIPYFLWNNRSNGEMQVWIRTK